MGFSLVGNSGDQTSTSNTLNIDYTASLNPQLDQQGAGANDVAVNLSPQLLGSNIYGDYSPQVYSTPLTILTTGNNTGDSALNALQSLASDSTQGNSTAASGGTTNSLSSLLSGDTIYYILGAIVLLFLAHHHK